ncbi:MAG: polymerase subunit epsilon [Actinomycetota bacterium]|nr:polymerase subunit epsilon [Actinomycetota bacterium]
MALTSPLSPTRSTSAAGPRRPSTEAPPRIVGQTTLDDIGTPLHSVTFCIVDLETTGGAPAELGITEIGAVKVRGGEVLGEFATLVNPAQPIPAYISVLTGITDATVAAAPRLAAALPAFLEFAQGCVLVAHNAPYDMGFLRHAAEALGYDWEPLAVVDTVKFSRAVLPRGEVPNHKLSTLAQHFRAGTRPAHRALDDARATVDVLHALLERVGSVGVGTLEEVQAYSGRVTDAQRRKRTLADGLPAEPGVYVFSDDAGESLYVGVSKNIRSRVRTYFTASEQRTRMAEMVALASSVTPIVCATELEAAVRELRLIAERKPRYNRRSRFPERGRWLKLTVEPAPRLSLVREAKADLAEGAAYLGPMTSKAADDIREVMQAAVALRTCSERLGPSSHRTPCSLAELGRCAAPCTGGEALTVYRSAADAARAAMSTDTGMVTGAVLERIAELSGAERFEEAAGWLAKLQTFLRIADRTQQRHALANAGEVVAAEPVDGGWVIHVIRHGRLAGAARSAPGVDPRPTLEALMATAEAVQPPAGPAPASLSEEADLILTWLAQDGVRLVAISNDWALPLGAAARDRHLLAARSAGVRG